MYYHNALECRIFFCIVMSFMLEMDSTQGVPKWIQGVPFLVASWLVYNGCYL